MKGRLSAVIFHVNVEPMIHQQLDEFLQAHHRGRRWATCIVRAWVHTCMDMSYLIIHTWSHNGVGTKTLHGLRLDCGFSHLNLNPPKCMIS